MKPSKDCKRMWYTGGAFYVGFPIDHVPVREAVGRGERWMEYFNGSFWVDCLADNFHETKEDALVKFNKDRKRRIEKISREIASLATAEPKWRLK